MFQKKKEVSSHGLRSKWLPGWGGNPQPGGATPSLFGAVGSPFAKALPIRAGAARGGPAQKAETLCEGPVGGPTKWSPRGVRRRIPALAQSRHFEYRQQPVTSANERDECILREEAAKIL